MWTLSPTHRNPPPSVFWVPGSGFIFDDYLEKTENGKTYMDLEELKKDQIG